MSWLTALEHCRLARVDAVVVSVRACRGSVPAKPGRRMVVSLDRRVGSIGGGELELEAELHARQLLGSDRSLLSLYSEREFVLGRDFEQCCGGTVTLGFDVVLAPLARVDIFGCGHVAQELARVLLRWPLQLCFHDSRPAWRESMQALIDANSLPSSPAEAQAEVLAMEQNPYTLVENLQADGCFIVMTHSHELDFELVEAVLSRGDSRYCGLIASRGKAGRFRRRLAAKGFNEAELARLTSPLGQFDQAARSTRPTPGLEGLPMTVALAAVADLQAVLALNSTPQRSPLAPVQH